MKALLYTQDGKQSGEVDLPAHLFEAKINSHLMHLALVRQHANARVPGAHTLKRDEVAGSTRKLFRQKGTGSARMSDRRNPIRRGGGVAWGPRNLANYDKDLPKKARRAALASALSSKAKNGKILALASWELEAPKTKTFAAFRKTLPASRSLLVIHAGNKVLAKSSHNLKYVKPLPVTQLNIHDLTKYDQILFEKNALEEAGKIYAIEKKEKAAK